MLDMRYPKGMDGEMKTMIQIKSRMVTECDKRHLKKTGEYNCWNGVNKTTKMSLAIGNL